MQTNLDNLSRMLVESSNDDTMDLESCGCIPGIKVSEETRGDNERLDNTRNIDHASVYDDLGKMQC